MSNSDDWEEIGSDGKQFATFKLIEQNGDKAIINAVDRDFYLTIDSNSVKWGPTKEEATKNSLYNGKWVDN